MPMSRQQIVLEKRGKVGKINTKRFIFYNIRLQCAWAYIRRKGFHKTNEQLPQCS